MTNHYDSLKALFYKENCCHKWLSYFSFKTIYKINCLCVTAKIHNDVCGR